MRFKGRYIDDRKFWNMPAGIHAEDQGEGMTELKPELNVITMRPRKIKVRKRKSAVREFLITSSVFVPFLLFVIFADILIAFPGICIGTLTASILWPAFVIWANLRDPELNRHKKGRWSNW